jgi:hypothetical protein
MVLFYPQWQMWSAQHGQSCPALEHLPDGGDIGRQKSVMLKSFQPKGPLRRNGELTRHWSTVSNQLSFTEVALYGVE